MKAYNFFLTSRAIHINYYCNAYYTIFNLNNLKLSICILSCRCLYIFFKNYFRAQIYLGIIKKHIGIKYISYCELKIVYYICIWHLIHEIYLIYIYINQYLFKYICIYFIVKKSKTWLDIFHYFNCKVIKDCNQRRKMFILVLND